MQYFDKSLPDEETHLTQWDFVMARSFHDQADRIVDDTSMYNRYRFEGDIGRRATMTTSVVAVNRGLTSRTIKSFVGEANPLEGVQRNAVRQTYLVWSDGRIPYTISSQYSSFRSVKSLEVHNWLKSFKDRRGN